jgi:hypothetical protein
LKWCKLWRFRAGYNSSAPRGVEWYKLFRPAEYTECTKHAFLWKSRHLPLNMWLPWRGTVSALRPQYRKAVPCRAGQSGAVRAVGSGPSLVQCALYCVQAGAAAVVQCSGSCGEWGPEPSEAMTQHYLRLATLLYSLTTVAAAPCRPQPGTTPHRPPAPLRATGRRAHSWPQYFRKIQISKLTNTIDKTSKSEAVLLIFGPSNSDSPPPVARRNADPGGFR